jgi:hypothetical protein
MKPIALRFLVLFSLAGAALPAWSEAPAPPPAPAFEPAPAPDLANWLGPIALYPDPLLAQVMAAATQPSDIVLAERYLSNGGDPSQADEQPWDPSVKALVRYPNVLQLMNDYLGWTTELGQAFRYQQPEVMDQIQHLRSQALELGNLQSTPQQSVLTENGTIEILPSEPDVIYVPDYEPDVVYRQHPPGPPSISFGAGLPMGSWMDRDFDWHQRQLLVWDHLYARPTDWWSSRAPALAVTPDAAHPRHPESPMANPRTRTTHFVMWVTPPVRVVTAEAAAGRGWYPCDVPPAHHRERWAGFGPGGPSLVVLPYHGSVLPSPGNLAWNIPAYTSPSPVYTEAFAGALTSRENGHDAERFSHRGHESREHGSHSDSHSHWSGGSHTSSPGHSGGFPGKH